MRNQGKVTNWNDKKGYGFVKPCGGGDQAFVHIKSFERGARRPLDGDLRSL
ncbi:cold shock domain-containing protein [Gilvimarinus gilvus]|uniref:cold shock domain-containing protein n=1 Tax=Gilvimarinus gilvus TaxID=3058038 RepID=UPI0034A08049